MQHVQPYEWRLRQGEVVEQGECERVFTAPQQEYTRQLLALS